MKREKKAVPIEALDEEIFLDALHDVTQRLRGKVSHFATSADVLVRESKTFTKKQREYFSGMVSSSDKLQATFNQIFESVVDDALKAASWKKSPSGRLDMAKILESLDDPQRRAKTSAALGKHIRPAFPRDPGLSQRKGLNTGIAKTIGLAWSTRVGALRSELLKHVTVVVGFAESLRTELDIARYKDEREFLLYITEDGEELKSALSEDAISGIDKDQKSKGNDTPEQTRKNKTDAISKRSIYTERASPNEKRKEGDLDNARKKIISQEALEGLKTFLNDLGVLEQRIDEAVLAGVALVAARAMVEGRPKWDDRKEHRGLSHLTVPRFIREVYGDLIDCKIFLPDGRPIWYLRLPEGPPVWQGAVRSNDSRVVQILQGYVNKKDPDDLGDADGLVFENMINRASPERPKRKARKQISRKLSR
jgi:hypothetical protein